MKIIRFTISDTLELKKNHPCGSKQFSVLRIGSDVRIRCLGCGHDLVVERVKLEKSIRKVIPGESSDNSGSLTES